MEMTQQKRKRKANHQPRSEIIGVGREEKMKKNILVKFECRIGDYEHQDYYIFDRKKSEWGYCKEFWGIAKKDSNCLKENTFWDNQMLNAISVYSETELTNKQTETLQRLGVA